MGLQTSGEISIVDIATEFEDTAPHALTEFYGAAAGIPTSGAITIKGFYGASNQFAFTIGSNQTNADLRTLALNAGWDGASNLQATIGSGVYISSNSTGTPALTISGSFPAGVTLINNGYIVGRGGNGGNGGYRTGSGGGGASGGGALSVSSAVTIQNNGTIAGGGGGGGGGGGRNYQAGDLDYKLTGGGGGGGRTSLTNSSGGSPNGGTGTVNAAGGGGSRQFIQNAGAIYSGSGGSGGGWGSSGSSGGSGGSGYPYGGGGGGAGYAVSGNGNITWSSTGARYGGIS